MTTGDYAGSDMAMSGLRNHYPYYLLLSKKLVVRPQSFKAPRRFFGEVRK